VPALIVLFTLFEMVLYHYRHSLPLAGTAGVAGRSDVPQDLRRDYEQSIALLEEAESILKKYNRKIERRVPSSAREELRDALDELRERIEQEPFDAEAFTGAHELAARLTNRHLRHWQKSEFREYAESIGLAVGVALLLRAFVVEAFKIPSGSMLPTLQIQDHIFVNKLAYGLLIPFTSSRLFRRLPPKRGDVIVFEYPDPDPTKERQDFIKRVIAVAGDTLKVEGGHPIINGWRVPSCRAGEYEFREGPTSEPKRGELFLEFLGEYSYLTLYEEGLAGSEGSMNERFEVVQGPYKVKPGETWVLGDNRNNSSDSRAWFYGRGGGVPDGNIKGRSMFIWLSFSTNGKLGWDRLFTSVLGSPKLPKGAPAELLQGIGRCLGSRPPPEQAVPPPPQD
jgi:signal peptidase I